MKIKRMVKRLFAVGTGVAMLGATAMGALAADLSNYPNMFVEDGMFNGYFVVGENAAAVDNLAMTDIAASMKYNMPGETSTVTVEGEAAKIETTTNAFNLGDSVLDVQAVALDSGDLPTTLADGTYVNDEGTEYAYEQKVDFATGLTYELFSDSDFEDKEPTLGIKISRNAAVLNYTMDFTKSPESDATSANVLSDFQDTEMSVLGNNYDIITATNTSGRVKLVMLSGALKDTLLEGASQTYTVEGKDYDVELNYVDSTSAKFVINGETTPTLTAGQTRKLADGTNFAVKEVLYQSYAGGIHSAEFYIGAKKLTLEDTQTVELNDEDVDGLTAYFTESFGTKASFSDIKIQWKTEEDTFWAEGNDVSFPGFGTFDLSYTGMTVPAEELIAVENSGNYEMHLRAPVKSGNIDLRLLGANSTGDKFDTVGGDSTDEVLLTAAGAAATVTWNETLHEYMPVTYYDGANAGETYILEVSKIDDTDGVTLKDVISGTKWEDKKNGTSFSVGSATLTLGNTNDAGGTISITGGATTYFDRLITPEGLTIYLPVDSGTTTGVGYINLSANPTAYTLYMREESSTGVLASDDYINVSLGFASNKVQVSGVTTDWAAPGTDSYYEIGDTEEYVGYVKSALASKVLYDTNPDQDTVEVTYHGDESYGNFYVLGSGSSTTVSTDGTLTAVEVVDATRLDSEIADVNAQNLIVVGGPCVNTVAAELLGNPADCAEGFKPGVARVKLFDTGDNMAMLVAGYTGDDTRLAGKVIAHRASDMSGMEVEIEGTTYSDATIGAPTVVEETPVVEEVPVEETPVTEE